MKNNSTDYLAGLTSACPDARFTGEPRLGLPLSDREGSTAEPRHRYDRLSRFLHWAVAAGIIYTTMFGYFMHFVSDEAVHKVLSIANMSVGTVVAALMVVRYLWRFFRPTVSHGDHLHSTHRSVANLAHEAFYLIIFCVLISGFLMLKHSFPLFGLVEFPRLVGVDAVNDFFFTVHRASCIALAAMLILHLFAVANHQLIDKYPIMRRMI